jgi:hypothetical protein
MDNARTLYAEYVSYVERNLNGCTPMTFDDFCKAHDLGEYTMMSFSEIANATLEQLTAELGAAGRDSTQAETHAARSAVACLLNECGDLRLYDSETGDLISSTVADEQAEESARTPEGHIVMDGGRKCYVSD